MSSIRQCNFSNVWIWRIKNRDTCISQKLSLYFLNFLSSATFSKLFKASRAVEVSCMLGCSVLFGRDVYTYTSDLPAILTTDFSACFFKVARSVDWYNLLSECHIYITEMRSINRCIYRTRLFRAILFPLTHARSYGHFGESPKDNHSFLHYCSATAICAPYSFTRLGKRAGLAGCVSPASWLPLAVETSSRNLGLALLLSPVLRMANLSKNPTKLLLTSTIEFRSKRGQGGHPTQ